ncbi:MAG: START domain-containing protein [Alcanivoracaceae bacterium]|jgi:hypothetical protein|nr:START domain-containing protein [Alcanivoracaceae bacterium]
MTIRLIALLLALTASALTRAGITDDPELDPSWKLITDRNGIQVYMRHRDESRLKTFRGVSRLQLSDEYALVSLLEDYESYPRWLHFIDGATEFNRDGPLMRQIRFTTQLPWPLNDREAVLEARVEQNITPEQEGVTVYLDNRPNLLPENPSYVRFPELEGIFQVTRLGNGEAEVVYQLVLDPGGYIPAWLANVLLRDAPYFTLERLRRIISRPEYQGQYFNYVELRGPGRPSDLPPARSYLYNNPPAVPMSNVTVDQVNPAR